MKFTCSCRLKFGSLYTQKWQYLDRSGEVEAKNRTEARSLFQRQLKKAGLFGRGWSLDGQISAEPLMVGSTGG